MVEHSYAVELLLTLKFETQDNHVSWSTKEYEMSAYIV